MSKNKARTFQNVKTLEVKTTSNLLILKTLQSAKDWREVFNVINAKKLPFKSEKRCTTC